MHIQKVSLPVVVGASQASASAAPVLLLRMVIEPGAMVPVPLWYELQAALAAGRTCSRKAA